MEFFRPIERNAKKLWTDASWFGSRVVTSWSKPEAVDYCDALVKSAYEVDELINVVPSHRLIYVVVPKAACTRIRITLGTFTGRHSLSLSARRRRHVRGPKGPRSLGMASFYELATDPATLRFSFTRNPYARLVSLWSMTTWSAPLVPNGEFISTYLALRPEIDPSLPTGPDSRLTFADFIHFTTATARRRVNPHWQLQEDLVYGPGLPLDFIGKVESFDRDFARVYDHVGASEDMRRQTSGRVNETSHRPWREYYTPELADAVYRAYEPDFDRFGYARAINS
jgi:hypothetical protein